jgi:hypothetical protein
MSDFKFNCPLCSHPLSAEISIVGREAECPKCGGRFVVPNPHPDGPSSSPASIKSKGVCPFCRSEIDEVDQIQVCPSCHTPHHIDCWKENLGCTVYGCVNAPVEEEKISVSLSDTLSEDQELSISINTNRAVEVPNKPIFLYIPLSRLVWMSIFSLGLYEAYWIYKNWLYLKERDHLKILPFWRGVYGIFYCHGIMKAIQNDWQTNKYEHPGFSAGGLATGWIILTLLGASLSKAGVGIIGLLILSPTFLFFIPIQKYINRVNERLNPLPFYSPWSGGHIICLIVGIVNILIWMGIMANQ